MLRNYFKRRQMIFLLVSLFSFNAYAFEGTLEDGSYNGPFIGTLKECEELSSYEFDISQLDEDFIFLEQKYIRTCGGRTTSDKPINTEYICKYDNGQIAWHAHLKNELKHSDFGDCYYINHFEGNYEVYYPEGHLKFKATLKESNRNGPFESYYRNGQLQEKSNYKNSLLIAPYQKYYENGNKQAEAFEDGRKETYYKGGQLESKTFLDGSFEEYWENGKIKKKCSPPNKCSGGWAIEILRECELYDENGEKNAGYADECPLPPLA